MYEEIKIAFCKKVNTLELNLNGVRYITFIWEDLSLGLSVILLKSCLGKVGLVKELRKAGAKLGCIVNVTGLLDLSLATRGKEVLGTPVKVRKGKMEIADPSNLSAAISERAKGLDGFP